MAYKDKASYASSPPCTAGCSSSVMSPISKPNRIWSSLLLFYHVPLKRNHSRLENVINDTPNPIGCTRDLLADYARISISKIRWKRRRLRTSLRVYMCGVFSMRCISIPLQFVVCVCRRTCRQFEICLFLHMFIYIGIYTYICIYTHMNIPIPVYIYTYTYVCMTVSLC